jgi:hypothetical protein
MSATVGHDAVTHIKERDAADLAAAVAAEPPPNVAEGSTG